MTPEQRQFTQLLADAGRGDEGARERVAPAIYAEMRRLARRQLGGGGAGRTMQATALVNEAYLKLLGAEVEFRDRAHFFAVAARAMRMILVDAMRSAGRQKRGGGAGKVTLDEGMAVSAPAEALLELDDALRKLESQDARKAAMVELHYFGGLSYAEIAAETGVSEATVDRELRLAKAWLRGALG